MLKKQLSSLDGVEPKYHGLYKKIGDLYILQIDPKDLEIEEDDTQEDADTDGEPAPEPEKKSSGGSAREKELQRKLNEFRNNNIKLRQQMDQMAKKLEGFDESTMNAAMAALEQAQNEEERRLLEAGKLNEVVNRRLAKVKSDYEAKLAAKEAEFGKFKAKHAQLHGDLRKTKVAQSIREAADRLKLKTSPRAMTDLMNRGFGMFDLDEEGNIVSYDGHGEERVLRVNDDNKNYSPEDFLKSLLEEAPHLFESASGADIRGGTGNRSFRGSGELEIDPSDPKSMGNRIDDIAKGKVQVRLKG